MLNTYESNSCGAQCLELLAPYLEAPSNVLLSVITHDSTPWSLHELSAHTAGKNYRLLDERSISEWKSMPCIVRVSKPDPHYVIVWRRFQGLVLMSDPSRTHASWIKVTSFNERVPTHIVSVRVKSLVSPRLFGSFAMGGLDAISLLAVFNLEKISVLLFGLYWGLRVLGEWFNKRVVLRGFYEANSVSFSALSYPTNVLLFDKLFHVKIAHLYERKKIALQLGHFLGLMLLLFLSSMSMTLSLLLVVLSYFLIQIASTISSSATSSHQQWLNSMKDRSPDGHLQWKTYVTTQQTWSTLFQLLNVLSFCLFISIVFNFQMSSLEEAYGILINPGVPIYGIALWWWQVSGSLIHFIQFPVSHLQLKKGLSNGSQN